MIFNFDYLLQSNIPNVLIIGSGPAGITLSHSLASRGIGSLILEIGDKNWSEKAHSTSKGTVIGDDYLPLEHTHLKFFGGSSNHWAGVCRHLDAFDFKQRMDIDGHMGWPINKSDLDPFYADACDILEVSPMSERAISEDLNEVEFGLSPPVKFSQKYEEFYKTSHLAHICLNSYLLNVSADNTGIRKANVAGPNGEHIQIDVNTIIFCGGGIENSRTLLWSNQVADKPVVQTAATLGKYWFEHPHNDAGDVRLLDDIYDYRTPWGMGFFSPSTQALKKYKILNACLRLQRFPNGVNTIVRNALCSTKSLDSKSASTFGRQVDCLHNLQLVWEQEPRAENRIELSTTEKDAFGVPRPILHWSLSELDYRTARVMMELMGAHIAMDNLGALRVFEHIIAMKKYPPGGIMAGCHHMGGTRMADNAQYGVVDKNSKIFGMDNGYVLGSSVFPYGGHANPTFTIVQLALRLAEHLSHRVTVS
jgi:choline dehydrogenase-like flavoprotein